MPLTTNFEADASDYAGDDYMFLWDFGDGNTSNEQALAHTYDTAGLYRVTLTVIGHDGSTDASTTIRVHPLPIVDFTVEPRLVMILNSTT
jgi:PKD repeat protein